jgi:hypothetical protein
MSRELLVRLARSLLPSDGKLMAGIGGGPVKQILQTLLSGPNTRWIQTAAVGLILLMLLAMKQLGGGPGFEAAVFAMVASALLIAFRGVAQDRRVPGWYRWIMQMLGAIAFLVALGSAAYVGVSVMMRLAI